MSRGGIGKSKKQASRTEPEKRGRPTRARTAQKSRPGLATGLGSVLLGLSTFVIFLGLLLLEDERTGGLSTGGQQAILFGLATLPLGFATVAMLSMRLPVIRTALVAFVASTAAGSVAFGLVLIAGVPAFFTAFTVAIGVGGMLSLSKPDGASDRSRLWAIGFVVLAVFVAEVARPLALALIGPFVVLPMVRLSDKRRVLRAGLS